MNENTQYWINQNGIQTGPHTIDQLKEMELTGNAYVWRAGMADWKPVTTIPELEGLYSPATDSPDQVPQNEDLQEPKVNIPPIPEIPLEQQPQHIQEPQPQYAPIPSEPCPPTNLVWAIISTIMCCLPLGVIAIIYSAKVSQKYSLGDIEGAKHYSEVSAWWCIGTIVGGIILSPFVSLIQMAIMG